MKKRNKLLMIVLIILAVVIAGCTSQNNNEPNNEQNNQEAVNDPGSNEQNQGTEGTELKQYSGEIVVSINTTPEHSTAFERLAKAYNEFQPNVKLVYEPLGNNAGDIRTALGTVLAAGNPRPDIVSGNYSPNYDKYLNFDKFEFDINPYTGNPWNEDFDFDMTAGGKSTTGERILMPTQAAHVLWVYNKEIFDEVGVEPPTNWDELVEISEKIHAAGYIPIASNYVNKIPQWLHEVYTDQYYKEWNNIVRAQPGDYNYDEELDGSYEYDPDDPFLNLKYNYNHARFLKAVKDGDIRFDDPGNIEMTRNFAKIFPQYAQQDFFVSNSGADYTLWLQQKAAIIIDVAGIIPTINQDMANLSDPERLEALKITDNNLQAFEWGTFSNPPMTGPLVQGAVRSVESAVGEYISIIDKNQEQTEMVLDFVMFWLSSAGYQAWIDGIIENGNQIGGPVMVEGVQLPEELADSFDGIEFMGNAEIELYKTMLVGRVADLRAEGRLLFQEAMEGKITPEAYAEQFQALWIDNFDDIVERAGLTPAHIENPALPPN